MSPRLPAVSGRTRQEWWLLGAVLIAVGAIGGWSRYGEFVRVDAEQRHLLADQAQAVGDQLSRQLIAAGAALRGVRDDRTLWAAGELGPRASRRLKALCEAMPGVRTMVMLDREGRVLAASRLELIGRVFDDHADFVQARVQADPQRLMLSPPTVVAPGVHAISLTLALQAGDGRFDGVVSATLDPDHVRAVLHSALYAPDVWAAIGHAAGVLWLTEPALPMPAGVGIDQPGSFFRRHRDGGRSDSVMTGPAQSNGEQRMMAQRTVDPAGLGLDRPMLVAVSRSLDAMVAPWWRETAAVALLYGLLVVTASLALLAMQRRQHAIARLQARQEASERSSARRLELALRGADLGLWDLDVRSGDSIVSERWNTMLGLPHQPFDQGSRRWSSRVHPDDWERVSAAQQAHLDGRTERFEEAYRIRHAAGHWVWVLDRGQVLERDAQGAPLRMVGTHMDTTERREAEEELRLLGAAVAHLNDMVLITEAEPLEEPGPRIVFVNPAFERLTGWTREEAIGRSPRFLQGPRTDRATLDRIAVALQRGESVHAELINTTRRGRDYWVEFDIVPLTDRHGRARHLVAVQRDVTERKRAEADRQALEGQLREAQKMESIGTLAGGIAHDFNNILAAILGNVGMAREDLPADHPALASLDQIHRAGLRARHLVQQILTFSRRDQRGLSTQPLAPVIEETFELLRATLPAGVRIDAVLPPEPVLVHGDATQIQQVLVNLCTNAWHALPERGGRIEVGLERVVADAALLQRLPELKAGACAHLWVRDNGSGMDEATRSRIFDPFFTTKPVGQGTGLGLSVVHGIVNAHQGAIAVDTAPGQGTTVHLYLLSPEAGDADRVLPQRSLVAVGGAGRHVLYIDDDEVMVVMVERLLLRAGFRVTVDTDAASALQRLRADPDGFDAVVTDFNMPELSGLDVAKQVAQLRPGLPLVISSGHLSEALRQRVAEAGVKSLLQKERTFDELVGLLLKLLAA